MEDDTPPRPLPNPSATPGAPGSVRSAARAGGTAVAAAAPGAPSAPARSPGPAAPAPPPAPETPGAAGEAAGGQPEAKGQTTDETPSSDAVWIVVVGQSGAGKSTVANRLLLHDRGEPSTLFPESARGSEPTLYTRHPQAAVSAVLHQDGTHSPLVVIDTPCLVSIDLIQVARLPELLVHAVVLVCDAATSEQHVARMLSTLVSVYGASVWPRLCLVFTRAPGASVPGTERDDLRKLLRGALLRLADTCLQRTPDNPATAQLRVFVHDATAEPSLVEREIGGVLRWAAACAAEFPPITRDAMEECWSTHGREFKVVPPEDAEGQARGAGLQWGEEKAGLAFLSGQVAQHDAMRGVTKLRFFHNKMQAWFPRCFLIPSCGGAESAAKAAGAAGRGRDRELERLGHRLLAVVARQAPAQAAKITGMILDLGVAEVKRLLADERQLTDMVVEAIMGIRGLIGERVSKWAKREQREQLTAALMESEVALSAMNERAMESDAAFDDALRDCLRKQGWHLCPECQFFSRSLADTVYCEHCDRTVFPQAFEVVCCCDLEMARQAFDETAVTPESLERFTGTYRLQRLRWNGQPYWKSGAAADNQVLLCRDVTGEWQISCNSHSSHPTIRLFSEPAPDQLPHCLSSDSWCAGLRGGLASLPVACHFSETTPEKPP